MVDIQTAVKKVKDAFPNDTPLSAIEYNKHYVFKLKKSDPFEEDMDPFCSVDIDTGNVGEFSLMFDGDISEVLTRFQTQKVWVA
jgi:hypothetical protein